MSKSLTNHPGITKFADMIIDLFDLTSEEAIVDCGGIVEVRPGQPPNRGPKYVVPFVEDISDTLEECGFKRVPGGFRSENVEAHIDNVENDERAIVISFREV